MQAIYNDNERCIMEGKKYAEQYRDMGYFIVDDAVEPDMLDELEAALRRAVAKVRSGAVVDALDRISVNGEGAESSVLWGLLAPEYAEPVFAEYTGSTAVSRYVQCMLGDQLRLGWMCAFAMEKGGYEAGWHRDFGGEVRDGTYEVEMEILGRYRKNMVKWHLALVDDPCLWIVPASNRRYRTDEEREVLLNNPGGEISGGRQIVLKRGQTVFWNGNTIHRGLMPEGMEERMTLTGALVKYEENSPVEVLDDRFRWMMADTVLAALPEQTRLYYDRWRLAVGA